MGNKRHIKPVYKECVMRSGVDKWGEGEAQFSKDMLYRYRLTRIWDESLFKVNFLQAYALHFHLHMQNSHDSLLP